MRSLASILARSRLFSPFLEFARMLRYGRPFRAPYGWVRFGSLRRLTPLDGNWGFGRGQPIDRYYIERFLDAHAHDIVGRVLEIGADRYASRFGGKRITKLDILDLDSSNRAATVVADLGVPGSAAVGAFDCVILTQTLQLVSNPAVALTNVVRALAPGGTALVTTPGISAVGPIEAHSTWYWSFTPAAIRELLRPHGEEIETDLHTYGNVLAATAFLHGLASGELDERELSYSDPLYPVTITARIVRRAPGSA